MRSPHSHDLCVESARWAHTAPTPASLEHLAGDPQLLQLHMLTQLTQVIHIEDLLPELEAVGGREHVWVQGRPAPAGLHALSVAHPGQAEA